MTDHIQNTREYKTKTEIPKNKDLKNFRWIV